MIGHGRPGISQLEAQEAEEDPEAEEVPEAEEGLEAEEDQEGGEGPVAQPGRVIWACHHSTIWTWAFLEAQEVTVFQPEQLMVEPLKQRPSLKME